MRRKKNALYKLSNLDFVDCVSNGGCYLSIVLRDEMETIPTIKTVLGN